MICKICFTDINNNDENISCVNNIQCNFHIECFDAFLNSIIIPDNDIKISWKDRKLLCPNYTCCNSYISINEMLNSSIKEKCVDILLNLEKIVTTENIINNQNIINTNINIDTIIHEIKNILVTAISCPKCKIPFIDFSGCLALTCSNCSTLFCAVCLKTHASINNRQLHNNVRLCLNRLSESKKREYQVHSEYFISENGWKLLKQKIQSYAITNYLRTIKLNILLPILDSILQIIKDEQLLDNYNIRMIEYQLFDIHIYNNKYILLYAQLYSSKYNIVIEDILKEYICISEEERKNLYHYINNITNRRIRCKYSIENTSPIILNAINDWAIRNNKWN
jgi:hypothetical protein